MCWDYDSIFVKQEFFLPLAPKTLALQTFCAEALNMRTNWIITIMIFFVITMANHGQRINDNGEVTKNQHSRRLLTTFEEFKQLSADERAQKIRDYQMLLAEKDQIIARLQTLVAMQQQLMTGSMQEFGTQMK